MNKEKVLSHVKALEEKHQALDDLIDKAESSGHYDDAELNALKKHRLSIKDEIVEFQNVAKGLSE